MNCTVIHDSTNIKLTVTCTAMPQLCTCLRHRRGTRDPVGRAFPLGDLFKIFGSLDFASALETDGDH
jgi:hypothetical protein